MCQFKTSPAAQQQHQANGGCRCHCNGAAAAAAAAPPASGIQEELRRQSAELLARYTCPVAASPSAAATVVRGLYSEAISAELATLEGVDYSEQEQERSSSSSSGVSSDVSSDDGSSSPEPSMPCNSWAGISLADRRPLDDDDDFKGGARRSRVRFADDVGHSLIEVRLYVPDSQPPSRPESPPAVFDLDSELAAEEDGEYADEEEFADAPRLVCHFDQPSVDQTLASLLAELDGDGVVRLGGLKLDARERCLTGLVLVSVPDTTVTAAATTSSAGNRKMKRVFVRVSTNAWRSHDDLEAGLAKLSAVSTAASALKRNLEAFAFQLPLAAAVIGVDLNTQALEFEFCLGCQLLEEEAKESGGGRNVQRWLWDNNGGANYRAQLLPPKPRATFCIDWSDEEDDY